MKTKVVLKDMDARGMVPKCRLLENIPLHVQEVGIYELKDHVEEKALNLDLLLKFGPAKKLLL